MAHVAGNLLTRPYTGGDGISFVDPGLQLALEAGAHDQFEAVISAEESERAARAGDRAGVRTHRPRPLSNMQNRKVSI